jgi:hypothetical protein
MFPLVPDHVEELRASGIDPVYAAAEAGVYTSTSALELKAITGIASWPDQSFPTLVFPYRRPGDSLAEPAEFARIKPRTPRKFGNAKPAKYLTPRDSQNRLYLPPRLRGSEELRTGTSMLVVVEGEKKALSVEYNLGLACIGLAGVTGWSQKVGDGARRQRTLLPDFKLFNLARPIAILFDSDVADNDDVARERSLLAGALRRAGAQVRLVDLPAGPSGEKVGADDYIVQNGTDALLKLVEETLPLPPREAWRDRLRIEWTKRGPVVKGCLTNAKIILENRAPLAFDLFQQTLVSTRDLPWRPGSAGKAWIDEDYVEVVVWMAEEEDVEVSSSIAAEAARAASRKAEFHPVRQYLDGLVWDGIPRLDRWLATYLGAEDTPYSRLVGRCWPISAVARVKQPGCKVDHMLVLEGPQGLGKSRALAILAGEWFADTSFDLKTKDAFLVLRNTWVYEIAELDAFSRAEVHQVKSFVTSQRDNFRPPYLREAAKFPRQVVFAGTTNAQGYLKDTTGERRFWPVLCIRIDHAALIRDRDQLWAEAVHRYGAGEAWWPSTPEEAALCEVQQERRQVEDTWVGAIEQWVAQEAPVEGGAWPLATIMSLALDIPIEQQDRPKVMRAADCCRLAGLVRDSEKSSWNGGRPRLWRAVP